MTKTQEWFAAHLAKDVIKSAEGDDEAVEDDVLELVCSCCNSQEGGYLMRFFFKGPGTICKKCYFNAPRCSVAECEQPKAYRSTVCRDHMMGEEIDPRAAILSHLLRGTGVSAEYTSTDRGDRQKGSGYACFAEKLASAMKKLGMKKEGSYGQY